MKQVHVSLFVSLMIFFVSWGMAGAAVITFDDLPGNGTDIVASYGGFEWSLGGTYPHDWRVWNDTHDSPAPSLYNVATNYCDGYYVGISSSTNFAFNGAYFSSFEATSGAASAITIAGFDDGVMVAAPITISLTEPYVWHQINLASVDMVTFNPGPAAYNPYSPSNGGTYTYGWFGMDNFTYNESVPEPTTIILLGFGLVGVAAAKRFKQ